MDKAKIRAIVEARRAAKLAGEPVPVVKAAPKKRVIARAFPKKAK